MESTGIVPTMPIGGNDFASGSGFWIFALLILLFGANGSFFGGNNGRTATVEDLNNSASSSRIEAGIQNNANLIERKTDALANGICDLGYTLARDFGAIQTQNAMDVASINATTVAQTQKILDKMCEQENASLRQRISYLETQGLLGNVVRYPTATTYTAGCSPFCSQTYGY